MATEYFISYNRTDRAWAEWIAWQLESAGHTTTIQAWDFRPGDNFVLAIQAAAAGPNARSQCFPRTSTTTPNRQLRAVVQLRF